MIKHMQSKMHMHIHSIELEQAGRAGARGDAKTEPESDWCPHHHRCTCQGHCNTDGHK